MTSEVQDYGTVKWKGRNLDGIVVRATVKTPGAERGQYKDECLLFGAVVDNEFQIVRDPYESDPYESKCNDTDTSAHGAAGTSCRAFGS